MNLLRSLISLELQEVKDESINTSKTEFQSAKELVRPKHSPSTNKPKLFAYSSVHLPKHKNIQKEQKRECEPQLQQEQEQEQEINICVENCSDKIKSLKLTLPSHFDLNKLEEEDEDNDIEASIALFTDSTLSASTFTLSDINIIDTDFDCTSTPSIDNTQECVDGNLECADIGIFPTHDFKFMYNIGHGAFGIVHKKFHMPSCQIVAVKHCRSTNYESIKSFRKEIKICEEFTKCKYIINMIEYGLIKQENKTCIALEYMNMSSLNKNKFIFRDNTINRIKYVCFCVLQALKCLHSNLYVHNDIKPSNILVNDHCDIKLTDFGCIKQMKDINIALTKPIGTEYYQSYEKRFVSPIQYNTKSDIYSLGITICELLLYDKQINKDIVTPFEIHNEIIEKYSESNSDLIDFLHKCLDRNYETRYDASQLLKHSFLNNSQNGSLNGIDKIEDIDDLEFMTSALIDYYSCYENEIDSTDENINNTPMTPIDNVWSDSKRIQNMAESTGFTQAFVQDFVSQKVSNLKNKLLKF